MATLDARGWDQLKYSYNTQMMVEDLQSAEEAAWLRVDRLLVAMFTPCGWEHRWERRIEW